MADEGQRAREVDARRQRMLDYLQRETSAQVTELAERFGISRMTVHRDLDALSEQGLIQKVHGGARAAPLHLAETDYAQRCSVAVDEKRAIARLAAALIEPGQIVAVDDSTTCTILADELARIGNLTVITLGYGPLARLHAEPGMTVICLGGIFHPHYHGFHGLLAEQAMRSLRANTVFISAQAVAEGAIRHSDELNARSQRALLAMADRRVLLANGAKFGATALHRAIGVAEFDVVITDDGIAPAELDRLRDTELQVLVADRSSRSNPEPSSRKDIP